MKTDTLKSLASRKTVIYGAFKGMGDLITAAPVIAAELDSGVAVTLLIFPQIRGFIDLIDFGPHRSRLQVCALPVPMRWGALREFLRRISPVSPDVIWISPHSPAPAASWKIPLLLWFVKRLYWPAATLAGLDSEPLSRLFDVRIPVDRGLPFRLREWTAYSALNESAAPLGTIRFIESIQGSRLQAPLYDVLIHPGAGAENRKWPLHRYAQLMNHLPAELRIAVLGLPPEVEALRAILPADRGIAFLTGTIEQAITMIGRSRVALTMDSGTVHFANVLRVPSVALFGASDPVNIVGRDEPAVPIYEAKWPCQPCGNSTCSQKRVYCMESLEPERIAAQIIRLLRQSERK